MAFTDVTYYKGITNIPNLDKDLSSFTSEYIEVYEKEILFKFLGHALYALLITNKNQASGIYKELISGKEYDAEVRGETVKMKWNGLVNSEKLSLLSYYVFARYAQINVTQFTGIGNSIAQKENAVSVSPKMRIIYAYAECAKLSGNYRTNKNIRNLQYNDIFDCYIKEYEESLFNFLYYNNTAYPDWIFNRPDIYDYNRFDL